MVILIWHIFQFIFFSGYCLIQSPWLSNGSPHFLFDIPWRNRRFCYLWYLQNYKKNLIPFLRNLLISKNARVKSTLKTTSIKSASSNFTIKSRFFTDSIPPECYIDLEAMFGYLNTSDQQFKECKAKTEGLNQALDVLWKITAPDDNDKFRVNLRLIPRRVLCRNKTIIRCLIVYMQTCSWVEAFFERELELWSHAYFQIPEFSVYSLVLCAYMAYFR